MIFVMRKRILTRFLIFTLAANITMPAAAINTSKSKCDNPIYRRANPDECNTSHFAFASTGLAVAGSGAALIGGALALAGMSGGGGGGSASPAPMPTLPVYTHVGGDVDSVRLASIMNSGEYSENFNQYNEIRLAWSLGRGLTGKNSTIAILDAGDDSWHGATVAAVAGGPIAPDAKIETYKIANKYGDFQSYAQIGEIIDSAAGADIYNASWSVEMRANQIYSREQIIRLTDEKFVSALAAAAGRDAIFVWAAGNDYDKRQSSALSALPRVITELQGHFINVVAWDDQTGALADFSNACGVTKDYCITAPGTNIIANDSVADGTSFAAPIVSAAVAVLREAFPYMTAPQITALIFETARDLGTPGVDEIYGHGMLDLERATRPVGAALVPMGDMNAMQPLRAARVSGPVGHKIKSAGIKLAYFDSYGRAFAGNMNDNIKIKNRGLGFQRLRGDEKVSMNVGNIELGMRKTDFMAGDGFLKTDGKNTMTFIAASNSFNLGAVTITQRTSLGNMRPRPSADSMISDFSSVWTASVSVDGKIGDWSFGVAVPDAVISGEMSMRVPTGRNADGRITFHDYDIDLAARPAVEFSVGYKFITAAFVDNPYGTDEIYVVAKKKIRF